MEGIRLRPESNFLNAVPQDAPPLFHYTDANAFISIARDKKIWFSNLNYQNDSEEYYYIFKLTENILRQKYNKILGENHEGILPFDYQLKPKTVSNTYSFSLSEREDMLSQWRGYCPNGGFCFSFNINHINTLIKRENMLVAKCIYKRIEQEEFIVRHIIGFTPEEYLTYKINDGVGIDGNLTMRIHMLTRYLHDRLNIAAPLLKHESFSEEAEWRIFKNIHYSGGNSGLSESIIHFPPDTISPVKFRSRKSLLVPYLEYELDKEMSITGHITNAIVSPTPHKTLAKESCNGLLKISNCGEVAENSNIPYVNW